jgi:RNA polymerase sporulation-specific sigma factor
MFVAEEKKQRTMAEFSKMEDEDIVAEIHAHSDPLAQKFLLTKYRYLVHNKAKNFFLIGAEKEDVVQEGMIGLFKAIRDFKPEKNASFKAFADLCVNRQIITAVKNSTRQKQIPLNTYVSINKPIYAEDSEVTLLDVLAGIDVVNPEEMVMDQEEFKLLEAEMNKILSDLEWQVLRCYLDGKSYQEISKDLGRHSKSIDNALTRVKRKLSKFKSENGDRINLRNIYKGLVAISSKRDFINSREKAKK